MVKNISRPGLRSGEPRGFRGNARVCQFHAADHGVNARVVLPRGFCDAAGFFVLQLWVQEGTAAPALSASHPDSVTESLLDVGNVVVRRWDSSRTGVHVGDLSMTQVLDSCDLLPSTLSERVLQPSETCLVSDSRKLRLELRRTESADSGR